MTVSFYSCALFPGFARATADTVGGKIIWADDLEESLLFTFKYTDHIFLVSLCVHP